MYCKNCLLPIKIIRDSNDYIGEEYYSMDCECGYYDNLNYHMRSYLFLEEYEIQSAKRDNKINQVLLFESYDEVSQIRNKLESILEIFNSYLEDWAIITGYYQKNLNGKSTIIHLNKIQEEEDDWDEDESKFLCTIKLLEPILIRDGIINPNNKEYIESIENMIDILKIIIQRVLDDENMILDEDNPIMISTNPEYESFHVITPNCIINLTDLSLINIIQELELEAVEYEGTYGQDTLSPYTINEILIRFKSQ